MTESARPDGVEVRFLASGEQPPDSQTWLIAVRVNGAKFELALSYGRYIQPLTVAGDFTLDEIIKRASVAAQDLGLKTVYVMGAAGPPA